MMNIAEYRRTGARLADYLPSWMSNVGPGGVEVWQWIALVAALLTGYIVGRLVTGLLTRVVRAMTSRTRTSLDDELIDRLAGPVQAIVTIATVRAVLPVVELHAGASELAATILLASFGVVLVWSALPVGTAPK